MTECEFIAYFITLATMMAPVRQGAKGEVTIKERA